MKISPQLTVAFWDAMMLHYGTRIVPKRDALEMRVTAQALDLVGILDHDRFMTRYTTVWGNRIYPSFVIGEGDEDELWRQIVVCVHEHQHVEQFRRLGLFRFFSRYLLSSSMRAALEAEAYCCNVELNWVVRQKEIDVFSLSNLLKDYGCKPGDLESARITYSQHFEALLKGASLYTPATLVGLEILDRLTNEAKLS